MKGIIKDAKEEIIGQLINLINDKISPDKAPLLINFTRYYYNLVAEQDLTSRSLTELYGAVLSHWNFLVQCPSGSAKIRVYNPQYEQHGWQSSHTVVEIVHPDMSFLFDSVRQELNRLGLTIHLMIYPGGIRLRRNQFDEIVEVVNQDAEGNDITSEAIIYAEINKQTDKNVLLDIQKHLETVLADVRTAVRNWILMRDKAEEISNELKKLRSELDEFGVQEAINFIGWMSNDNFTFLGYCDCEIISHREHWEYACIKDSCLGLLQEGSWLTRFKTLLAQIPKQADLENKILLLTKANLKSTVHRPGYMDLITVKRFDNKGQVIGVRCFLGLYTSSAYNTNPLEIPILRDKVNYVLSNSKFPANSHSKKELLNILLNYPRDDLFQIAEADLYRICLNILHMQERRQIRLFIHDEPYKKFISCLVFVPKDIFNTKIRKIMGNILSAALNGCEVNFSTTFSESILARIHFVIRITEEAKVPVFDESELEKKLAEVAQGWQDNLRLAILEYYGEEKGSALYNKYEDAFPTSYQEKYSARNAVFDIEHLEKLVEGNEISTIFSRPLEELSGNLRFKLFHANYPLPLSDVLPILENMGMRVLSQTSHEIILSDKKSFWINDFSMQHEQSTHLDVDKVRDYFQQCFLNVWIGNAENDAFNKLVLVSVLSWRETAILRAYAKYFKQLGFTFSEAYIQETLIKNNNVARDLVSLFKARFNPKLKRIKPLAEELEYKIHGCLDSITILDEDKIIRRYLEVILATTRTNYFVRNEDSVLRTYFSFKLNPHKISELPKPIPTYEIYVYSPRVEGVHLRSSKVARGGLRLSDRKEDFRTEVLGLMKAQQVKNSVIVPAGAKGGFVAKKLPQFGSREEIMQEIVFCYSTFIRGLLDITDNMQGTQVIYPENVIRLDEEDDPYLVVAADKGTASFSDIANKISQEYNFWLGDAFASGGSSGYDHKKMGITARGVWESIKRHFYELNLDIRHHPFTVVGIGDMSGDVFGNGMLLSKKIKLIAAFDHRHIFIDPDPDCEISYAERQRLFNLSRSSWEDYNSELISKGGGVYKRTAKYIKLSPEGKKALGITQDVLLPNDLIKSILKAPVDLLWNGGIGTYIKSAKELNVNVEDRSNDLVRINGKELRCKVIGEGGNLGCTQLGRVEFALNGGLSFTDFIDNSGGVDCSDHEVNIKILLNAVMQNQELTLKQRNHLLETMTDEVAKLVLRNNYNQSQAVSLAAMKSPKYLEEHARFINDLEKAKKLDRALEYLPSNEEINKRKIKGIGLTRPEISILSAYSKIMLKQELLNSTLPNESSINYIYEHEFPKVLRDKYHAYIDEHSLRKEIIATQLSNNIVNYMGITFIKRLYDETGASITDIVRSYVCSRNIFELSQIMLEWQNLEQLEARVPSNIEANFMSRFVRVIRRSCRWFLKNRRGNINIEEIVNIFAPLVKSLANALPDLLTGENLKTFSANKSEYLSLHLPENLAHFLAAHTYIFSFLDIIDTANRCQLPLEKLTRIYFMLSIKLELNWLRTEITDHPVDNNWDALARSAYRDDIDYLQCNIARAILHFAPDAEDLDQAIEDWLKNNKILADRWLFMLNDLRATKDKEFTIFSVAIRELSDLAQFVNRS